MHGPIERLLAARTVAILDGALATELERRGADLRDPLWSAKILIERPELIRSVHLDYFRAGADIGTTATYQATFEGFARRGIGRTEAAGLLRRAVALTIRARDDFWNDPARPATRLRPLVAASLGPYGAFLADGSEYRGHYPVSDAVLRDFHGPRLDVLAESGADLIACETIPCLREAVVLARLLEESTSLTAWISFSGRDGSHNCEGEDIGDCAAALDRFGRVAAVGVNCTPPEFVAALLEGMAQRTAKPLLAYPNSGERYDAADKRWRGASGIEPFAAQSQAWYHAGARLIGGCCRTTPGDIAALCLKHGPQTAAGRGNFVSQEPV